VVQFWGEPAISSPFPSLPGGQLRTCGTSSGSSKEPGRPCPTDPRHLPERGPATARTSTPKPLRGSSRRREGAPAPFTKVPALNSLPWCLNAIPIIPEMRRRPSRQPDGVRAQNRRSGSLHGRWRAWHRRSSRPVPHRRRLSACRHLGGALQQSTAFSPEADSHNSRNSGKPCNPSRNSPLAPSFTLKPIPIIPETPRATLAGETRAILPETPAAHQRLAEAFAGRGFTSANDSHNCRNSANPPRAARPGSDGALPSRARKHCKPSRMCRDLPIAS
jgi:hypothetical protein